MQISVVCENWVTNGQYSEILLRNGCLIDEKILKLPKDFKFNMEDTVTYMVENCDCTRCDSFEETMKVIDDIV